MTDVSHTQHETLADARRSRDPTGTTGLRRTWRSVTEMRLRQLRAQLRIAVVENDMLGLGGQGYVQYQPAFARLRVLHDWLERKSVEMLGGMWAAPYVKAAWQSGHGAAMRETRKTASLDEFSGHHLVELTSAELAGMAAVLTQQVTRAAEEAITRKDRPAKAYQAMVKPLDKAILYRLRALVNVISVKAHNQAKLAAYREQGVTLVGVNPELEVEATALERQWETIVFRLEPRSTSRAGRVV